MRAAFRSRRSLAAPPCRVEVRRIEGVERERVTVTIVVDESAGIEGVATSGSVEGVGITACAALQLIANNGVKGVASGLGDVVSFLLTLGK